MCLMMNFVINVVISGYRKKLVFAHFVKWVHDTDALRGFDLTDRLMQELFSDLDPHKKGHLTESDWENAFGKNTLMIQFRYFLSFVLFLFFSLCFCTNLRRLRLGSVDAR